MMDNAEYRAYLKDLRLLDQGLISRGQDVQLLAPPHAHIHTHALCSPRVGLFVCSGDAYAAFQDSLLDPVRRLWYRAHAHATST